MNDNVKACKEKFFEILKLLKPQTTVQDDTFIEKIQSYLKSDEYLEFIKDPQTLAWIDETVKAFDENSSITQQVANFTLKLLELLCSNEWDFVSIKEKGLLEKIQLGISKHPELQKPSTRLSHLKLLRAISKHSIGLHWLKQTKSWLLVIEYYQKNGTIYIMRESSSFLYEVLTKFTELMKDEVATIEALEAIMKPVLTFKKTYHTLEGTDKSIHVDNDEIAMEVIPTLNIVTQILWLCIEAKKRSRVAYYILLKYRYENTVWMIQDSIIENVDFLSVVCRAHIVSNFARLSNMDIPSTDEKATDLPFDTHAVHFYNLLIFACHRRVYKCMNMVAECHHQLWSMLDDGVTKEVVLENHDLKFGDQVIMMQTFPIVYVIKLRYKADDECINDLCTKLFNMSCEHTIRLLYQLRDELSHENFDFVADLAASAIHSITAVKKFLKRDRAILAFQILIHVLKGYVDEPIDEASSGKNAVQLVLQAPNLLSALLNALNEMINVFNFSWKECVESTTVVPLLLTLLENPNLSSRHTVESLKLIQTSIEHFLAPNLALLLDKVEGSGMENLGPTIFKHLHSLSWEVRDSVLELLHSIVEISDKKFPPFQKHILQHEICQTVEIIAKNDSEPYVRASAFKSLTSMIKIRLLWDNVLHELDVKKYAVEVLGNESEGVVRREAVACIAAIYDHRQIPENCLDTIFSVLAHCAVNDFYWEVKVNSLEFWNMVIARQFIHQGMIDGSFPAVTFSKEHRKIITLTEKEIQLRLHKVLNELSLRGCLGILIASLQDSDLEVIKKVTSIIEKMMGYLSKYNFVEEYKRSKLSHPSSSKSKPVVDSNYADFRTLDIAKEPEVRNSADCTKTTEVTVCDENGEKCSIDTIIDSIINTDDITLLSSTYKANCQLEPCNIGKIDENLYKKFAAVSTDEFLNIMSTINLKELLNEKSEWLQHTETFLTLLEDVLRSFGQNVELDCY